MFQKKCNFLLLKAAQLLVGCLIVVPFSAACRLADLKLPSRPTELWSTIVIETSGGGRANFVGEYEMHHTYDDRDILYKHYQVGLKFSIAPAMCIQSSYRITLDRVGDGLAQGWKQTKFPVLDVILSAPTITCFNVTGRMQIQSVTSDGKVYAGLIKVGVPLGVAGAFVSDEVFCKTGLSPFENRAKLGLQLSYQMTRAAAAILIKSNKTSEGWLNTSILSLEIDIGF